MGTDARDDGTGLERYQRWETRHRKVVIPAAAVAAMALVAIVEPTDFKWYIGIVAVAIVGYRAAAAREKKDSPPRG